MRNECGAITWLPTSAWEPRYVLTHPQSVFVFRCYLYDVFHHYLCERSNNNHTARETNRTGWRRSALHCWCILVKALRVSLHCGCIREMHCGYITGWRRSALHCGCIMRNVLWVFETETTTTATHAVVSERLEPRYGSVAQWKSYFTYGHKRISMCNFYIYCLIGVKFCVRDLQMVLLISLWFLWKLVPEMPVFHVIINAVTLFVYRKTV